MLFKTLLRYIVNVAYKIICSKLQALVKYRVAYKYIYSAQTVVWTLKKHTTMNDLLQLMHDINKNIATIQSSIEVCKMGKISNNATFEIILNRAKEIQSTLDSYYINQKQIKP